MPNARQLATLCGSCAASNTASIGARWQHCKITVLLLRTLNSFLSFCLSLGVGRATPTLSRQPRQAVYDALWQAGAKEQTKWSRNPRTPDIRVVATLKVRRVERIGQAAAPVAAAAAVEAAAVEAQQ